MMAEAAPSLEEGVGGSGGGDQPKVTLQTVRESVGNLVQLQKVHKERLARADDELTKLHKYRTDYEHLTKRLRTLPDKTTHEVMVPIGKLGFMPGRLVHTNEVLVLLGDNWFAERSAKQAREIVTRRVRDCDEKIRSAEATKQIHEGWLQEAQEVMSGEEGDRIEILEELTEEQFQQSQEEHRKMVVKHYQEQRAAKKLRLEAEDGGSTEGDGLLKDNFVDKLEGKDKRSYEDIMQRLDQLELEEEAELDEEEGEGESEDEENNEEETEEEEDEIENTNQDGENMEEGDLEDTEENSLDRNLPAVLRRIKPKLKRRVSWADDARPLYTIIPDDLSEQTYRIKYSTGPLSLSLDVDGSEEWDKPEEKEGEGEVQSPSDIYKVFGAPAAHEPQPRGILKKSTSLPLEDKSGEGEGWCCPPQPLDVEGDTPEDQPPPPPSPPPRRAHSLKPAFSYRVLEHKIQEPTDDASSSDAQPKKVSKFKAARMKK